jgi:flagellar assembly factor FliW
MCTNRPSYRIQMCITLAVDLKCVVTVTATVESTVANCKCVLTINRDKAHLSL